MQPILGFEGSFARFVWSNGVKYFVEMYSSTPNDLAGSSFSGSSGLNYIDLLKVLLRCKKRMNLQNKESMLSVEEYSKDCRKF